MASITLFSLKMEASLPSTRSTEQIATNKFISVLLLFKRYEIFQFFDLRLVFWFSAFSAILGEWPKKISLERIDLQSLHFTATSMVTSTNSGYCWVFLADTDSRGKLMRETHKISLEVNDLRCELWLPAIENSIVSSYFCTEAPSIVHFSAKNLTKTDFPDSKNLWTITKFEPNVCARASTPRLGRQSKILGEKVADVGKMKILRTV